jgi:hypothetical protein
MRAAVSGDLWAVGQNNWGTVNTFTSGTPVKNACLKPTEDGYVTIPYNLIVNGDITAANSNPFWLAGKVAANGNVLTTRGRYGFTCARNSAGNYTITTTTNAFSDTNYIINITCQVDGGTAYARINVNAMTVSSFTIITYVNGVNTDVIFHFTAIG